MTEALLTDEVWSTIVDSAPAHVAAVRELVVDAISPAQLRQLAAASTRISSAVVAAVAADPSSGGNLFAR